MRLKTKDGESLDLRVTGYQFPQLETELYDSNWLIVEGSLTHQQDVWTFRDPCLLTYEAVELANWIEQIAKGHSSEQSLRFLEPVLWFEYTEDSGNRTLKVHLEAESCPTWARSNVGGIGEFCIEVPSSEESLVEAVGQWRDEIARFPQRAER